MKIFRVSRSIAERAPLLPGAFPLFLALAALVFILSFRLRDREMSTYHKIGATQATIRLLKFAEVGVVAMAGLVVAASAVVATKALAAEILPKLLS